MKVAVSVMKLILLASLVNAGNVLVDNKSCYKVSKDKYGSSLGQEANDFEIMQSNQDQITLQHRVRSIQTCSDEFSSKLNGIALQLSNGDSTKDIKLNTYGQLRGRC